MAESPALNSGEVIDGADSDTIAESPTPIQETNNQAGPNAGGQTGSVSIQGRTTIVHLPQQATPLEKEMDILCKMRDVLQREYIDISLAAGNEFSSSVPVQTLQFSILCLPFNIKEQHKKFVNEAEARVKEAESAIDIMFVIGKHYDYLHYSLLKYVVDLYGSDGLKKKMEEYVKKITVFRKETRLEVFSEVCPEEPEETNEKIATMVTKHQIDWKTSTLEDVEKFRVQICRELSLYDFTVNLKKVERGCVEVTWAVPRSLVAYIQHCVKPSSDSLIRHHIYRLTIDGFIAYDSSFVSSREHKVIRLQRQTLLSHVSYLTEELPPEAVIPHLVQRRLLSPSQAAEVLDQSTEMEKAYYIVDILRGEDHAHVGVLPTFCAALVDAKLPHVAEKLLNKFQTLMKGERVSYQQEEDEVMISGESSVQLSPPPPGSYLITAQVEGSTLTRSQYQNVCSLISSLLCIPTGDLVYDGYTINPTTIHWHTTTISGDLHSLSLYTEIAQHGIQKITVDEKEIHVAHFNEMDLICASYDGDVEAVEFSLRNGVPVDITTPNGESSLMWASINGHVKVVDKLLQHGASTSQQNESGERSLMLASFHGHVEVVDKLLQHGARVDLQDEDGMTSLMWASLYGHVEVVSKLLQHKANVDLQLKDGRSSLMLASQEGHVEVVDKLLQHGARVDIQLENGVSALMLASYNGHDEVVDKLLQHKASIDLKNKGDNTALLVAIRENELATVSVLLTAGANPNVCNKTGQTPLLLAVRKNNVAMVRELVKARVDVDHMEQGGLSALMMCCEEGNSEMAKLLLQSGANPNLQQSSTGYTALMFASKGGHLETVKILREHGADHLIRNTEGRTALDVASANQFPNICNELHKNSEDTSVQELPTQNPETEAMTKEVKQVVSRVHEQIDQVPGDMTLEEIDPDSQDRGERRIGKKIPATGEYRRYLQIRSRARALWKRSGKRIRAIPSDIVLFFIK